MKTLGARASPPAFFSKTPESGEDARAPRGWHHRGYLPHFDGGGQIQAITYRLADALPAQVPASLDAQLPDLPRNATRRRQRIQAYLDAGHGACWLRHPDIAAVVLEAWQFFDTQRYELLEWVIMPNHVHVLVYILETGGLSHIVQGWKSFSAHRINSILGRHGTVWQADYWDRYIRNERHFMDAVLYIHENPLKAGLVSHAEDWPWSSARAMASSPAFITNVAEAGEDARAPISQAGGDARASKDLK